MSGGNNKTEANISRRRGIDLTRIRGTFVNLIRKHRPPSTPELRRGAAEGAGERRGDVGSDYLLGRFFWRWFFAWWPADAGWRIDQAAMLEDFFDLRAVQGLELEQRLCDGFECVSI